MNIKNLLKTFFCLTLMAMCWMPMSAQDSVLRGDVDNDGNVEISDVTMLIDYLLGGDVRINQEAADVDKDGLVDISDVSVLIDYLLSGEWPYEPEPEPEVEPIVVTVSGVTFKMIFVKGGTFMMGARDFDPYVRPWESPAHQVTLSDYYVCETEVTQALWRAIMGTSSSNFPCWFTSTNGYTNNYERPAENVTFSQCQSFITKLNQKTGKTFRMLTEAEWEYAARGGSRSKGYMYPGSDDVDAVAWHRGNIIQENGKDITQPVAQKAPNELGLYDMAGSVSEWCSDWYALYSDAAVTNPTGPSTGTTRIVRGGCWDQSWRMCRPTYRYDGGTPTFASPQRGLRIALSAQ